MLWYIAAGSALGGVSRYLVGGLIQRALNSGFPTGTLVVNLTGSFLLGLFLRYAVDSPPSPRRSGRFSRSASVRRNSPPSSTFSYETLALLENGEYGRAGLYAVLSVVLALAATALGFMLARGAIDLRPHS